MRATTQTSPRRSFTVDPRLLIGLLLVIASVAGVVGIVAASDNTVQVYAARDTLSPGDRIESDDLVSKSVQMDDAGSFYLLPGEVPDEGLVVTRSVDRGELVPASAIGSVVGLKMTSIVLESGGELAASVQPGSLVDVWSARETENSQYGAPVVLVPGATVVRLVESASIVSGGETTAVEVLVPRSKVARVLEAVANSDAVSIVPSNLPGRN